VGKYVENLRLLIGAKKKEGPLDGEALFAFAPTQRDPASKNRLHAVIYVRYCG